MLREIWSEMFERIGAIRPPAAQPLIDVYSDASRSYHNLEHIENCLKELRRFGELKPEIAVAIFYHDCIYDTRRDDNEALSADFAANELRNAAVPEHHITNIRRLILATQHKSPPTEHDEQVIVDVDLSILGAEPSDYWRYAEAVRKEYGWVDDAAFSQGRSQFLKQMLGRPRIYSIQEIRDRYEVRARENMLDEVALLAAEK